MNHALHIRSAQQDDLATVIALERRCAEAPHWTDSLWNDLAASLRAGDRLLLIAEHHQRLAGFLVAHLVAGVAEIESLGVEPSLRRLGIGRALCQAAILWARQLHAASILLEVRRSNAAARALYAGLGFQTCGLRPRYYNDPIEDAVLMQRLLRTP